MQRRKFISFLGGAAVWPLAARAQQPGERMRRIAVLEETAEDYVQRNREFAKFQDGLVRFGWVDGRTVRIDHRFAAADARQYAPLARELGRPAARGNPLWHFSGEKISLNLGMKQT